MKDLDTLFERSNQHKFSYVLLARDNISYNTITVLDKTLNDKVNVVSIKSSKYTNEELEYIIEKSNFVVTGLGRTLDIVVKLKKPALVDVDLSKTEKQYPSFIDFFDPYRNEDSKPFYTDKDLDLLVKEVYNQLDKHRIDYVNFM